MIIFATIMMIMTVVNLAICLFVIEKEMLITGIELTFASSLAKTVAALFFIPDLATYFFYIIQWETAFKISFCFLVTVVVVCMFLKTKEQNLGYLPSKCFKFFDDARIVFIVLTIQSFISKS